MRSSIGGYDSLAQAQMAVRGLEPHVSIQDMVIAERGHLHRRSRWDKRYGEVRERDLMRFLVLMNGDAESIARARALLGQASRTAQPDSETVLHEA